MAWHNGTYISLVASKGSVAARSKEQKIEQLVAS
jgi:hypothetical protein